MRFLPALRLDRGISLTVGFSLDAYLRRERRQEVTTSVEIGSSFDQLHIRSPSRGASHPFRRIAQHCDDLTPVESEQARYR